MPEMTEEYLAEMLPWDEANKQWQENREAVTVP
jgi:hypothetical protein